MAQPTPTTIKGPDSPLSIVFGEAQSSQRLPCCAVAAIAFVPKLPSGDTIFMQHGEALSQHPLAHNNGIRYWCISQEDDPLNVLAMCGTIRRPLLIRDSEGVREEEGYCVFMVATHTKYRRLGVATMLMKYVAAWLDGEGGVVASMLYTSVGNFYVPLGWEIIPSTVSTITHPSGTFQATSETTSLPSTRPLSDDEIPALCDRDVADLKQLFQTTTVAADEVHLAVLPNTEMITYLHAWGDILNTLIHSQTPDLPTPIHGAICDAADTWMIWHYAFDTLKITRVRTPPGSSNGKGVVEALAGLVLCALEEAQKWGFAKVTVWEPSEELLAALEIVEEKAGVEVKTQARDNSVTSVRWNGAEKGKKTVLHLNETYAAS